MRTRRTEKLALHDVLIALAWAGDLLALTAACLITKGIRFSFALFVFADLLLMGVQLESHIWSQVALFFCFAAINVVGYIRWGKK